MHERLPEYCWKFCVLDKFACTASETDMFWKEDWDPQKEIEKCWDNYGVETRPFWPLQQWGGEQIQSASNIVFSNGEFDPWSAGGVLEDISESVVSIMIAEV